MKFTTQGKSHSHKVNQGIHLQLPIGMQVFRDFWTALDSTNKINCILVQTMTRATQSFIVFKV